MAVAVGVAEGKGVAVAVTDGLGDGVSSNGVSVAVGEFVGSTVGVCVGGAGAGVHVEVGSQTIAVGVASQRVVGTGVGVKRIGVAARRVGLGVGDNVGDGVLVGTGVLVGGGVFVGGNVFVGKGVLVGVTVGVEVTVGVAVGQYSRNTASARTPIAPITIARMRWSPSRSASASNVAMKLPSPATSMGCLNSGCSSHLTSN